jgi:AcrR family transcriptional regulator
MVVSNQLPGKAEAILDAADRLFTRFGYRRTAMDDIASEASVAKGTLYLYFKSKEALFCAIQARNVLLAEQLCDAAEARGGDLTEQIFRQLEAWFGMMHDRYGSSDHLPELSAARSSVSRHIAESADRAFQARLARIIEAAHVRKMANLTATGLDAANVVSTLLAAARGAKYVGGKPLTPSRYRTSLRHIAQLFAAALRPDGGVSLS